MTSYVFLYCIHLLYNLYGNPILIFLIYTCSRYVDADGASDVVGVYWARYRDYRGAGYSYMNKKQIFSRIHVVVAEFLCHATVNFFCLE